MTDSCDDHSTDPWLAKRSDEKEDLDENEMRFNDNFVTNTSNVISKPLPDSQQYIKSLEKKLEKVMGKTKDISTKDVLKSLSTKRVDIIHELLHSNDCPNYDFESQTNDSNITNNSTVYQYLERRLFPQTQALTEEELQRLLESDLLEKLYKESIDKCNQ